MARNHRVKQPSIKYQLTQRLIEKQHFGTSDKKVSKDEIRHGLRDEAKKLGIPLTQMPLPGIYSHSTMESYLKQGCRFTEYVRQAHPDVKKLDDAKTYAKEYLEYCQNRGDSAWTLRTVGAALGKVFECPSKKFGFEFPKRHDHDRTRSVTNTKYDRVVEHRNAENIGVLEITGFRRCEAEKVTRDQISPNYDKINNVIGKGGKARTITVIAPKVLKAFVETHPRDDGLLLGKLEKNLDIHGFRHEYADKLYRTLLGEKYDRGEKTSKLYIRHDGSGRRYDHAIAEIVSHNLGHNRVDTTIISYLK